jgi:hypothetical protein
MVRRRPARARWRWSARLPVVIRLRQRRRESFVHLIPPEIH